MRFVLNEWRNGGNDDDSPHLLHDQGCTQTINLFECTNRVRMVDLPGARPLIFSSPPLVMRSSSPLNAGYGYAKAPRDEAQKWHQFVTTFLSTRKAYVTRPIPFFLPSLDGAQSLMVLCSLASFFPPSLPLL